MSIHKLLMRLFPAFCGGKALNGNVKHFVFDLTCDVTGDPEVKFWNFFWKISSRPFHCRLNLSWYCTFKYAQNWLLRRIVASVIMLAVIARKSCKCNTIWRIKLQSGSLLAIFFRFARYLLHWTARRNKKNIVQFLYEVKLNLKDHKFAVFLC